MKKILVTILLCVAVTAEVTNWHDTEAWEKYKKDNEKFYNSDAEEEHHKNVYLMHQRRIRAHNVKYERGYESYDVTENPYADIPNLDFVRNRNGISGTTRKVVDSSDETFRPRYITKLPREVNWRRRGAVTPVRNQGTCQSCWAFSSIGALEGQIFLATKKLIPLSAQNLVDCSYDHRNRGCWGGWMNNAFRYIRDNGGIETEDSYGYQAEGTSCRYTANRSGVRVTGVVNIPAGSEELLAAAVAAAGPVAAAVDASSFGFQFYSRGVYYDPDCSHRNINHAVLVVGYGTDPSGGDYWLVKNSWGPSWGEGGYMKLARNRQNHCGIASAASFPKVKVNRTRKVKVNGSNRWAGVVVRTLPHSRPPARRPPPIVQSV